jgi:UDP-N-acetylmuramate dehydrogenase
MTSTKTKGPAAWPCAALADAELASRTTMRVGGRVEWLLEPQTPDEVRRAWLAARERGFTPRVLGGGANLVVAGDLDGVVIATDRVRRMFRPLPETADGPRDGSELLDMDEVPSVRPLERDEDTRLVVWAGTSMPGIVRATQALGWRGFEGLVGVPGNVGGGVAMNAGGRWGSVWDVVELVRVLDADGVVHDLPRAECDPGYRDGKLGGRIVLGAVLRFELDAKEAVRQRTREFLLEKKTAQPVTEWSSGCIFRNPDPEQSDGRSAGKLIEDCGGKQLSRGDAVVSPKHANFIVNRGKASAADVLTLIDDVHDLVLERAQIHLVREVKVWG